MSYRILVYETIVRESNKSYVIYIPAMAKLPQCETFCCDMEDSKIVYRCGEVCGGRKVKLRRQRTRSYRYSWLAIPVIYARVLGIEEGTRVRVSFGEDTITLEVLGKGEE